MSRGYDKSTVSVYQVLYHFVWIPKRRKRVLVGKIAQRLKELIKEKLKSLDSNVVQLKVMPDHVHLFAGSNPKMSPNYIMCQIKGYTAKVLRSEFPELRRIPSLWTRSYFVSTAGNVSKNVIEKYIKEQTNAED
jgi:putative transposase